jgi:hypothetical protein
MTRHTALDRHPRARGFEINHLAAAMSRNGQRHPARPQIELSRGGGVSEEEAAAIAAAIEQFMRDTAPAPDSAGATTSPWLRTALLEGTRHGSSGSVGWGA